jgi:site-specific DNA-cytosine methylase
MVLLLDLFSGTGSIRKVAIEMGWDVVSLDRDMEADIKCDIVDWVYNVFPEGMFDVIWASPPCTEYSRAKTTAPRNIEGANAIVTRTLEIIAYFKPKYFIIENPQTGLLKDQRFMSGIGFRDVDYCKYGMPYRKRTRLWNNITTWEPRALCKRDCGSMNDDRTRHIAMAQRGPNGGRQNRMSQTELYRVPGELIREILESCIF